MTSPAALLQSRTPSRSLSSRGSSQQRPYQNKSLVHLGTYDPVVGRVLPPPFPKEQAVASADASLNVIQRQNHLMNVVVNVGFVHHKYRPNFGLSDPS